MPALRPDPPRSLADDLRSRSDDALAALLTARPDLAQPVPADTTSLAARASTRGSVQRAMDQLSTPTLQVLEVMAALPAPVSRADVSRACGGSVQHELEVLRAVALVWGPDRALRLVRSVAELLGAHPAGLGPPLAELAATVSPARIVAWCADLDLPQSGDPVGDASAVADLLGDRPRLRRLLSTAPAGARDLLDRLTWDGPVGSVANAGRDVRAAEAQGAVDWLLAHALLVPVDDDKVVVPREAGISLRGGRVLRQVDAAPPALVSSGEVPHRRVDGATAGAAAEAVRRVHEVAELWSRTPAPVLRGGGLGVRELRRVAATLDVDDATAARAVELAYAAGLVGQDGEADPSWMPTPAYDTWWAGQTAEQWDVLARAWLTTSRVPALVGTRDARDTVRSALGDAVERPSVVAVRREVLEVLALAGQAPPTRESLAEQLRWRRPRGPAAVFAYLVDAVLADAAWLGVTGSGVLSAPGRALLESDGDEAATALSALLPAPVQDVLLQADLTAVAPGPLASDVARELELMADVDSRGGATVYRFDGGSIRRALDAGRTAADVVEFLRAHSRTPVPQPLEYLVADVARRHGRIRVGAAGAYLRSDDEAVLGEVMADRRTAVLRLRRIAPTVLTAQADPTTVLETLHQLGLAPAAEAPDGTVVLRRADVHRTALHEPPRPVGHLPGVTAPVADAVVRSMRSGDHAEAGRRLRFNPDAPAPRPMEPAMSLAELRAAAADRRRVWIGVSDPAGAVSRRLVEPLGVAGGRITVFDHGLGEVRTVSVHRVTGVAPAEDDEGAARPTR